MPGNKPASAPIAMPGAPTFNQLWEKALQKNNLRSTPSLPESGNYTSVEDVLELLEQQKNAGKNFRAKGKRIRSFLKPFVKVVAPFVDAGAEIAAASVCRTTISTVYLF